MGLRSRSFVAIFLVENHALLRTFQSLFPALMSIPVLKLCLSMHVDCGDRMTANLLCTNLAKLVSIAFLIRPSTNIAASRHLENTGNGSETKIKSLTNFRLRWVTWTLW